MSTQKKLTAKQQRFIDEYLIDLNATQAAIRAGYSGNNVGQEAYKLLKKPLIRERVSEALKAQQERTQLTADEVIHDLRELRDICMGRKRITTTQKHRDEDGNIEMIEQETLVFDPTGANKSLELLGKHLGLFTEKMEVNVGVKEDVLDMLAQLEQQNRQQSKRLAEKIAQRKGQ